MGAPDRVTRRARCRPDRGEAVYALKGRASAMLMTAARYAKRQVIMGNDGETTESGLTFTEPS